MAATELNRLSRAYAAGEIDFYNYRQNRTVVLDQLVNAEIHSETQPAVTIQVAEPEPVPAEKVTEQPPKAQQAAPAPVKKPFPLIPAVIGAVVVVGILAGVLSNMGGDETATPPPATGEASNKPATPPPRRPFAQQAMEIINSPEWMQSRQGFTRLEEAWSGADLLERENFLNSPLFQQVTFSIREGMKTLRAVEKLGDESARRDIAALEHLAGLFGIDVSPPPMTIPQIAQEPPMPEQATSVPAQAPVAHDEAPPVKVAPPAVTALAPEKPPTEDTRSQPLPEAAPTQASPAPERTTPPPAVVTREPAPEPIPAPEPPVEETPVAAQQPAEEAVKPEVITPVAEPVKERVAQAAVPADPDPPASGKPPASGGTEESAAPPATQAKPAPVQTANLPAEAAALAEGNKRSCSRGNRRLCFDLLDENTPGPMMREIPKAKDLPIGSMVKSEEQPVRTISGPDYTFYISETEISYGEYSYFCSRTGRTPPAFPWKDSSLPVVNVSWDDAVAYTQWLSGLTGTPYRLPSELEWEIAARGGTKTPYPFGDHISTRQVHFSGGEKQEAPIPVKPDDFPKNRYRLYHVVGNVREWVSDDWKNSYDGAPDDGSPRRVEGTDLKVVRGGSYADGPVEVRSASRASMPRRERNLQTGFRVALGGDPKR